MRSTCAMPWPRSSSAGRISRSWARPGCKAPPYSMSPEDAADFAAANHMQTVTAIYYGQGAQPDPFNFDDALAGVRGAQ